VDREVVHDDTWVSSRGPQDLRAFDKAIVAHFAESVGREVPGFVTDVGWGRLLAGTAAVAAAAGYAAQRRLWTRRGRAGRVDADEATSGRRARPADVSAGV